MTLNFTSYPKDLTCDRKTVAHVNVATSGEAREQVTERHELILRFTLPAMTLAEAYLFDLFMVWAQGGGQFDFHPNTAASMVAEYYHCVVEEPVYALKRVGLQRYSNTFTFRILPDGQAPATALQVLKRIAGVAG